jgi:hypothetical protein
MSIDISSAYVIYYTYFKMFLYCIQMTDGSLHFTANLHFISILQGII